MNGLDTRRYEMLTRVRDFGAAHSDLFPKASRGAQAFAAVAAAVAELTRHAAEHVSGRGSAREGTSSKAVTRDALHDDLDAISRTARALALDIPGLDEKFRLPRGNGDQTLLTAARAFRRDATPLAKEFIEHDLPKDFLADLDASIKDFENAIHEHEAGKDTHVAARAALDTAMQAGLDAVRRLDAIVRNRLRNDAPIVAIWERARHVEYPASRAKNEAAAEPTPAQAPLSAAEPAASPN
jgi:hypothetical protein